MVICLEGLECCGRGRRTNDHDRDGIGWNLIEIFMNICNFFILLLKKHYCILKMQMEAPTLNISTNGNVI